LKAAEASRDAADRTLADVRSELSQRLASAADESARMTRQLASERAESQAARADLMTRHRSEIMEFERMIKASEDAKMSSGDQLQKEVATLKKTHATALDQLTYGAFFHHLLISRSNVIVIGVWFMLLRVEHEAALKKAAAVGDQRVTDVRTAMIAAIEEERKAGNKRLDEAVNAAIGRADEQMAATKAAHTTQLSAQQNEVLLLYDWSMLTSGSIAAINRLQMNSVEVRQSYAKKPNVGYKRR
jgi:hypothetical protein